MNKIYTDGGCSGNPGIGGWAFLLETKDGTVEQSGSDRMTTNNKMELTAVIKALQYIQEHNNINTTIHIFTDSKYVYEGITSWIHTWRKNKWRTAGKKPVKNKELWEELQKLAQINSPQWHWVRGHSGESGNERCDTLVKNAIAQSAKSMMPNEPPFF